jgi:signal transduction histidine kinase
MRVLVVEDEPDVAEALDPSRGHASGSAGLGLAIARDIATAHGANIVLTDAAGGGTRAVVTLPGAMDGSPGATFRSA